MRGNTCRALFDLFWSMLVLFLFMAWVTVVISVLGDVVTRNDIGGGLKAMWIFLLIAVPWFGVLGYLVTAGDGIARRRSEAARAQDEAYIREAAGSNPSTADESRKLSELKESGVLTEEEFSRQKAKLLA